MHEAAHDDGGVLLAAQEPVRAEQAPVDEFRRAVQAEEADGDGGDEDDERGR